MNELELCSTKALKRYITDLYEKAKAVTAKDGVYRPLSIRFVECMPNSEDGEYCFSGTDGYHFCSIERSAVVSEEVSADIFDIAYKAIESEVFWMAVEYERKHRIKEQDSRRMIFSKELQYLSAIGEEYKNRAEFEISQTLVHAPYQDSMLRR